VDETVRLLVKIGANGQRRPGKKLILVKKKATTLYRYI